MAWYRSGKDVQQLLPHLATYLGHACIASTQRYLQMTPELLQEVSCRFAAYAQHEAAQEVDHARADEAASLRVNNLQLGTSPSVRILDKG